MFNLMVQKQKLYRYYTNMLNNDINNEVQNEVHDIGFNFSLSQKDSFKACQHLYSFILLF